MKDEMLTLSHATERDWFATQRNACDAWSDQVSEFGLK